MRLCLPSLYFFFFFNDTATTEIYTLSLHDALPISAVQLLIERWRPGMDETSRRALLTALSLARHESAFEFLFSLIAQRSEEHTSELQSRLHLVCRLLLEKKKKKYHTTR